MTTDLLIEIIGAVGLASYVLSYALLQLGFIQGNSYIYPSMNLIGAVGVAVTVLNNWNLWTTLISLSFATFSIIGIVRHYRHRQELIFDEAETAFFEARFYPLVSRLNMRRILDRGAWENGAPGLTLTTQDAPVTALTYLSEGGADIVVDGQTIAQVGAGEFIGELGCLDRRPASASAILNQPSKMFQITSDALNTLLRNNAELKGQVEAALAGNVRSKLLATNKTLQALMASQAQAEPGPARQRKA